MQLPFRRNKNSVPRPPLKVPKEVVDYYQAEKRDRRGLTWLLGLATLAVTILLAFGLFFGGRWVYRKIADRNTGNTPTTSQLSPPPVPTSSDTNNTEDESHDNNSSADQEKKTNRVAHTTKEDLPNTGPGNIIAIFIVTTVLAAGVHFTLIRRTSL